MAKQPKGKSFGEGPAAFSRQSNPSGSKVPKVSVTRAPNFQTGVVPADVSGIVDKPADPGPSGTRVPDWRK
jgi:hypothetical protein